MPLVVAQPAGCKAPMLFQVKPGPGGLLGIVPDETRYTGEKAVYRIASSEVLVHLPDSAPYGKVYGVTVEPIIDRWVVRGYGYAHCYIKTDAATRERISRALVKARRRVEHLFPGDYETDLLTSIRHPRGNKAGSYHYKSKGTDALDLYTSSSAGEREIACTIAHELGHRVWFRILTPEQRARWVKFYGRFVQVDAVTVEQCRTMVAGIRQMRSVKDYLSDADPEVKAAVTIFMAWLKRVHKLQPQDVQDVLSAGAELPLPDVHLHRSDVDTPVTLYSKSAPDELFCEAVGSWAVNDLSDKALLRMLGQGPQREAPQPAQRTGRR